MNRSTQHICNSQTDISNPTELPGYKINTETLFIFNNPSINQIIHFQYFRLRQNQSRMNITIDRPNYKYLKNMINKYLQTPELN